MIVAAKGNVQMLNLMMANKTLDVNKTDRFGVNAFWIAAFYGRIEFLQILLTCKANIYATNQNGSNALHIAVKRNNLEVVKYLIKDCNY